MELTPQEKRKILIIAAALLALIVMAWFSWPETEDKEEIEYYNGDAVPLPVVMDKTCSENSDCNFTLCCGCASDCTRDCKKNPEATPCKCDNGVCVSVERTAPPETSGALNETGNST